MIRWALTLLLCLAGLTWAGRDAARARREAQRELGELNTLAAQAKELAELRAAVPSESRPGSGIAARVTAVLARCGLPASAMATISPESAVPAGAGFRRQRATLSLLGLTLPQLGSFLEGWRTAEPAWVIAGLELSPANTQNPTPGADLPLRITATLEAVYIEQSAP